MTESPIDSQIDLVKILQKHRWSLVLSTLLSLVSMSLAMRLIPKQYKSRAVISIQPSYFQNPLSIGMESREALELKNQRELLIKQTLNYAFLEELGTKYYFFRPLPNTSPSQTPLRSAEEYEGLRRRFEVYFLNPMTFQISFTARQAETSYKLVSEATQRVISTLQGNRRKLILSTQKAIQDDLEAMAPEPKDASANRTQTTPSTDSESLTQYEKEKTELESKIPWLKTLYTASHPEIKHAQIRLKQVLERIDSLRNSGSYSQAKRVNASHFNIHEDLLRKWHYLNVTLALESQEEHPQILLIEPPTMYQTPVWPKFDSIAVWSTGGGLTAWVIWVLATEWIGLRRRKQQ